MCEGDCESVGEPVVADEDEDEGEVGGGGVRMSSMVMQSTGELRPKFAADPPIGRRILILSAYTCSLVQTIARPCLPLLATFTVSYIDRYPFQARHVQSTFDISSTAHSGLQR